MYLSKSKQQKSALNSSWLKLTRSQRSARGQAFLILCVLVGLVIIPSFGFVAFEIGRAVLGQQQLYNACDAAALTAVATLASSDNTDPTKAHTDAMQAALTIFRQNSVLGGSLASATISSSKTTDAPAGKATLFFEFVNPITKAIEPLSSPDAKIVRVYSSYGSLPAFGKYLGLSRYVLNATAKGAVPQLDIILCFDVSGSMDDQTPITLVKRKWDPALGKIVYDIPTGLYGKAQGKLYDIIQPGKKGSSLNGLQPQNLKYAQDNAGIQFTDYRAYLETVAGSPTEGLRSNGGYPDQGMPPGNFPPGVAPTWDGQAMFTDLVVNVDGKLAFTGCVYKGYNFPDLATLVEAARGNLENNNVFYSSKANTSVSVRPMAGYKLAYEEMAAFQLQPLRDSKIASLMFTNILNTDTDCHFGFVAFDGVIGTTPTSNEEFFTHCIDTPYGAIVGYPMPNVSLNSAVGATNYASVNAAINSVMALGSTNIGAAVHEAVQQLKAKKRPDSVRAIVLFTDGAPTNNPPGPLDSDGFTNARKAALEAKAEGIPIYTIGLAQNPDIVPDEISILNDVDNNPTTGGMAAIAGGGGTFHLVTDSRLLRAAFEKIARHLVELVAAG